MEPAQKRAKVVVVEESKAAATVLHGYWRSGCSWRVRIALNLKEVPFEYRAVHLVKEGGQQFAEGYAKMNPSCEVPTLEIDGETLAQSSAIIEYLEETRPDSGHRLLPEGDAKLRAKIRRVAEMVNSGIQPVQNLRIIKHVASLFEDDAEKTAQKMGWAAHWIAHGFRALEAVLSDTAGRYCFGDEVTLADLYIPPQVYNANRFSVDMSEFPLIQRINTNLAEHPAFAAAQPSEQPDAVN